MKGEYFPVSLDQIKVQLLLETKARALAPPRASALGVGVGLRHCWIYLASPPQVGSDSASMHPLQHRSPAQCSRFQRASFTPVYVGRTPWSDALPLGLGHFRHGWRAESSHSALGFWVLRLRMASSWASLPLAEGAGFAFLLTRWLSLSPAQNLIRKPGHLFIYFAARIALLSVVIRVKYVSVYINTYTHICVYLHSYICIISIRMFLGRALELKHAQLANLTWWPGLFNSAVGYSQSVHRRTTLRLGPHKDQNDLWDWQPQLTSEELCAICLCHPFCHLLAGMGYFTGLLTTSVSICRRSCGGAYRDLHVQGNGVLSQGHFFYIRHFLILLRYER